MEFLVTVPLLILDDLGMRKLPLTAAEELLEIIMRRYERASTMLTSNRPVEDWGKLLGDAAAVSAMLDRLLHHGHVLKCGPRSWRTKTNLPPQEATEGRTTRAYLKWRAKRSNYGRVDDSSSRRSRLYRFAGWHLSRASRRRVLCPSEAQPIELRAVSAGCACAFR
jgi:hypothetical protein